MIAILLAFLCGYAYRSFLGLRERAAIADAAAIDSPPCTHEMSIENLAEKLSEGLAKRLTTNPDVSIVVQKRTDLHSH